MPALLAVDSVDAGYGAFHVLHDVTFAVAPGEVLAVLGRNGAGKSTLLKVIAGLVAPRAGRVIFDGRDVTGRPAHEIAGAGLCLVPEGRGVFPGLTVGENLRLAAGADADLDQAFALFPTLAQRLGQRAATLSGGEQQMLAMARAACGRPRLVMVDEPSLGLAPNLVDAVFATIRRLHATGCTVILVEQYVTRALRLADRVVILERGRARFAGEPGEMRAGGVEIDAYLGGRT